MSITVFDTETSSLDAKTAFGIEYGGFRLKMTGEDIERKDKIRGTSVLHSVIYDIMLHSNIIIDSSL